jgi:hypothetical protein
VGEAVDRTAAPQAGSLRRLSPPFTMQVVGHGPPDSLRARDALAAAEVGHTVDLIGG